MQLVDSPVLTPGECICGRTEGPMVDTLRENHQGRVYVCSVCIGTMCELTGALDGARRARDSAIREAAALRDELAKEKAGFDELQKAVVLTLRQGAVSRSGAIQLRRRPI